MKLATGRVAGVNYFQPRTRSATVMTSVKDALDPAQDVSIAPAVAWLSPCTIVQDRPPPLRLGSLSKQSSQKGHCPRSGIVLANPLLFAGTSPRPVGSIYATSSTS